MNQTDNALFNKKEDQEEEENQFNIKIRERGNQKERERGTLECNSVHLPWRFSSGWTESQHGNA